MDIGFRRKWKIDDTSKERGDCNETVKKNWTYKQQQDLIKIIINSFIICRIRYNERYNKLLYGNGSGE